MKAMTQKDVRDMVEESGLDHARFCIEQYASQVGSELCHHLFAEWERLDSEQFKADFAASRQSQ